MNSGRMYQVIRKPIVSEKSTRVGELHNQIMFDVARDATKAEVREAVEKIFEVKVISVQIANLRGKTKRFGRTVGKRNDHRRAFVRLKKGDDINFHEGKIK